jgi:hypothetical protein
MAIDASLPVSRELTLASAVSQASLTKRDRELQVEEGQPPLEVAKDELEALRWHKREDLREKWKRRQEQRARRKTSEDEGVEQGEEAQAEQAQPEMQSAESLEEDETGTLFDDRS